MIEVVPNAWHSLGCRVYTPNSALAKGCPVFSGFDPFRGEVRSLST